MDRRGQMSVELIFIAAISIIVLLIFTVPIAKSSIESNMDVLNSLNGKFCVDEIANGIDSVYCQGEGSKKTVNIVADNDFKIGIQPKSVYSSIRLHDDRDKTVKKSMKCGNVNGQLFLSRGANSIVIEWPEDSDRVTVRKV